MRATYRVLAYAIALLVVVQAGALAWAFFGMTDWISNENGVVDKALLECTDCEQRFTAEWGFAIHMFFNGLLLIPLISLLLLIVSFFAKVPGGVLWALGIVLLIVLQVILLPMLSREVDPAFGALHGVNAIVLLVAAVMAGRKASAVPRDAPERTAVTAG
ncbi:hypothetical protein [Nocardioides euryhalodurans]|uniref:Uncharacterized protein n=1 Tax=Nocardioides euryhalodurans TaxID=2518370 RepID=A0A4P7GGI0_9ACTN|nr:hypothetical protein [Nocardioides euryhalodurans]QBR90935.1 hypothetical protein EXE57_00615 [Nocardioides euryhalodurans]